MSRVPFRTGIRLILLLGAILCLSTTLHAQEQDAGAPSSLIGEAFITYDIVSVGSELMGTITMPKSNYDVILVADGDTLRTKVGSDGRFSFPEISARLVALMIAPPEGVNDSPFLGAFELMPGENLVIVPWQWPAQPENSMLQLTKEAIVTLEGDTWIYHYPRIVVSGFGGTPPSDKSYLVSKLMEMPGVNYDSRKHLLSISGDAIHRTHSGGAYIFGMNPAAR